MDLNAAFTQAGYDLLNNVDADERATYEIDGQTVIVVLVDGEVWIAHAGGVAKYAQPCGHSECVRGMWEAVNAGCAEAEAEAREANPLHSDLDSMIMAEPVTVDMFI